MNKPKTIIVAALALASLGVTSGVDAQQQPAQQAAPQLPQAPNMTFFVTSVGPGKGADLGGLEGADQYCQQLAQRHGAGGQHPGRSHGWPYRPQRIARRCGVAVVEFISSLARARRRL